jgi:ribose 5-phosphate isomerase A
MSRAKEAAGIAAAALIEPNTIVGLGSGTTAACFIEALGLRIQNGLILKAVVATSKQSADLARRYKMPLEDLNHVEKITVTVDGADEIDSQKRIIKGGGGAHVRERIVASSSEELIILIDESKIVPVLGKGKVPVEILPFGSMHTKRKLEELGYFGKWRSRSDHAHTPFLTDNGNFLFDLYFTSPPLQPEKDHEKIKSIAGVVDTGIFLNMAGRVLVGHEDGTATYFNT